MYDFKNRYINLEHRTKTLADVRIEDHSKNMDLVQPIIENYENKNKKIHESRVQN